MCIRDSTYIEPSHYLAAVSELQIGITAEGGATRLEGDTHFCFLVPERAFEDTMTMMSLVNANAISAKMAFCMRMVDFSNPLRSDARESLVSSVPHTPLANTENCLDQLVLTHAAEPGRSQLLQYWDAPNLLMQAKADLEAFLRKLEISLSTVDGLSLIHI